MTDPDVAKHLNEMSRAFLPGLLSVRFTGAGENWIEAELDVRTELMAPNGYLHARTVVTLADTCCGVGCARALPEGASGFTTIELKSNFLGTTKEGSIACHAAAQHLGRTTQLWDATVTNKNNGRTIALFRCTQLVLWPKPAA
jgi:uncharacterized protein (TIGR00369 family)